MRISIDSHHFDTDKAKAHWRLSWYDSNSNHHAGYVYLSSSSVFYVYTPSQWANQHGWAIMSASEILSAYNEYLDDDEKQEIAEAGGVEWT